MGKQEQVEWDEVNKLLQHHGFKPVSFADPVENKNLSDLVLLDKKSANEMRATLSTMLRDSERRQALIQQLVKSNNQLKEEVQKHMSRAAHHSQRVTDLEALMDQVKSKVQDMEDRFVSVTVQHHSRQQQLQQEKEEVQKCCEDLEEKLSRQRERTAELQKKLCSITREKEEIARSLSVHQVYRRTSKHSMPKGSDTSAVSESNGDEGREARLCVRYHQLLTAISDVVIDPRSTLQLHRRKYLPANLEQHEFPNLLSTLEVWAQQLCQLKELHRGLFTLMSRLLPWQLPDGVHAPADQGKVEDMILLLDTILESTTMDEKVKCPVLKSPTRFTLGSMVSHFQKLFDVTSISGVYPRMNEVYTRLGEMTNTMRNLKEVLDLDSRVSNAELINHVTRLVQSSQQGANFYNLLGDADIQSIFVKVKQHQEFFPAFHALIVDILQVLGVTHLDDIIPTLKSLKQEVQ